MNNNGNFMVKALEDYYVDEHKWLTKGKIYEYINGQCVFDSGFLSGYYNNFKDLLNVNESYRGILEEVKGDVFSPIKVRVASICDRTSQELFKVGLKVDGIEKDVVDIDILDFFGIDFDGEFIEKVIVRNYVRGTKYTKSTKTLTIGKEYANFEDLQVFTNNTEALKFAYEVTRVFEAINEKLTNESKEIKVFAIKHTPDGKRYFFRSKEELTHGDLVYCDTSMGLAYGVVDGIEYENIRKFIIRRQCSKKRENLK